MRNAITGLCVLLMASTARGEWKSETSTSLLDDSTTVTLSQEADSPITGFPGTVTTPELVLRCQQGKTDVFFVTGLQADLVPGRPGVARVMLRYDKKKAFQYHLSGSTSGTGFFVRNADDVIAAMARHNTLVFQFTPYNSNPQTTTFDLRGLSTVLPALKAACDRGGRLGGRGTGRCVAFFPSRSGYEGPWNSVQGCDRREGRDGVRAL